jgi:hypothetical protein
VAPLNLAAIHKEMTHRLNKSPDEVLHVDKGKSSNTLNQAPYISNRLN